MEKMEGKYFENTINKLKEAKDAERIEMRGEFKSNLRAGLVEEAGMLPIKTDWSDAVLRWKYLFGAVPALAVLTIVAANFANLQVKMPAVELIPQDIGQNVSSGVPANTVVRNENNNKVEPAQSSGIVTFSSALVMPPADVLARARAGNQLESETPTFSSEGIQPVQNNYQSQPLSFLDNPNNSIKLNPPKTDLFTFDLKNTEPTVVTIVPSLPQADVLPPTNIVPVQPNLVGPSVSTIPADNVSQTDNSIRSENNARVESSQKIETVPVSQITQTPPQTAGNNNVQTDVAAPTAVVQKAVVVPINLVNVDAAKLANTTEIKPLETLTTPPSQIPSLMDVYVNPVSEAMVKPEDVNLALDASRIIYDGMDKPLINALVLKELQDKNGNLSSDYYVKVGKTEDGKLKISLFEFGQVKEIIFMGGDANGQFKTVTVINY